MISPPRTQEEARQYRYGVWAGNPAGSQYREGECAYAVSVEYGHRTQCSRLLLPGYGPAKLYCRQHARMIEKREAQP